MKPSIPSAMNEPAESFPATEDHSGSSKATEAEQALRQSQARLESELADTRLLQNVSSQLINGQSIEDLYEKIVDAAVHIMRSDFASMQMLYPQRGSGGELRLLAFRGFNPQSAKFWEWVRADSESTCGAALRTGQRVVVADVRKCDFMAGSEDLETYLQTGINAVQSTPLVSRGGKLLGMISTHWREPHQPSERDLRLFDILARQAADLVERKQAEDQLRRNHDTFYHLVANNPFGIYIVDARFVLQQVSVGSQKVFRNVRPLLGRDFAEVLRTIWLEPFATEAINRFRHTLGTGEPYHAPCTTERRHDISEAESYDWNIERIVLPDGEFGVVCYFYDMTERQRAESALRESEQRFRVLADSSPVLIWVDGVNGAEFVNQAYLEFLGVIPADVQNFDWAQFIHPDDRETYVNAYLTAARRRETFAAQFRFRRADGEYRWMKSAGLPRFTKAGEFQGYAGSAFDITDIKQAEEALRRSEKLAATGQLAATIAHEINNPMQALTNLLALLTYKTESDSDARMFAEMAQAELGRMAHIAKQMLSFHRDTLVPVPLRITEVLEDALELWAIKLKGQLRVERKYDSTEHVMGFPGELRQVFVNLIGNAIEAAPEGEALRVHIFSSRDRKQMRPGVRVVIADRGAGIKSEHLRKIFEPFFTTKNEKGTGLGLWVTKQAVERHGGHIRVRTSTRRGRSGTVFSVFLPGQTAKIPTLLTDSAAVA